MLVDIILCENSGPSLRFDYHPQNKCPCCYEKSFEILVEEIDVGRAFSYIASKLIAQEPTLFHQLMNEMNNMSERARGAYEGI